MADPTPYDILQDNQISALQDIVTPYYQPPGDQEYSFPVVGQGVSSQMFQQISRAAGTGIYIQSNPGGAHEPYYLTTLPGGAAATNANNQMLLKVAPLTGRAEASIEGFFHTLLQDMVIDFPAVSTNTTYYLCLTYDPRREEEEQGPIRVEVHTNSLPITHGRKHIVLWTVARQPNQLLTDAVITQTNQWLGHVINVWSEEFLPEPTQTEYGTLAVVVNPKADFKSDPVLYTNRGIHGWHRIGQHPRQNLEIHAGNQFSGTGTCRKRAGGLDVTFDITGRSGASPNGVTMFHLPGGYRMNKAFIAPVSTTNGPYNFQIRESPTSGRVSGHLIADISSTPNWTYGNLFIPDYYFSQGF